MYLFSNEDMQAISNAYWEEENEFKIGTHPTQVAQRIEQNLNSNGVKFQKNIIFRLGLSWV